jgi:hypothetical protein
MMFRAIPLTVLLVAVGFAETQQAKTADAAAPTLKMCKMDKLTYSPGALVRKGDRVLKCTAEGKWTRATNADLGRKQTH